MEHGLLEAETEVYVNHYLYDDSDDEDTFQWDYCYDPVTLSEAACLLNAVECLTCLYDKDPHITQDPVWWVLDHGSASMFKWLIVHRHADCLNFECSHSSLQRVGKLGVDRNGDAACRCIQHRARVHCSRQCSVIL